MVAFVVAVGVGASGVAPADGPADFRMVGVMHQNLAAVNEIDEGVVYDDFARVKKGAVTLKANAAAIDGKDFASLHLTQNKKDVFEGYLSTQKRIADEISKAAGRKNAKAVLQGIKELIDGACVKCHSEFRERDEGRTPRVLFMRSLLSSVRLLNRGIAMDDYALVAREAREIGATAHILTWSQVVESMFLVDDPEDRAEFRQYFETLSSQAIRVEHAATQRDSKMVSAATELMLAEGCVGCHDQFRDEIKERVKQMR